MNLRARRRLVEVAALGLTLCLCGLLCSSGARASGGNAEGWGWNISAQLGAGFNTTTGCTCSKVPVGVSDISGVTQVAAGYGDGLALLSDGTARSWGWNRYAELGDGTITERTAPVTIPGLSNVVALAAGEFHNLALLANGTVEAWGRNSVGQLGVGGSSGPELCEAIPCSRVPVLVPGLTDVVAIAASEAGSMALLSNGTVETWGDDTVGELGDGSATGPETCGIHPCGRKPIPVSGLSGVVAIAAGGEQDLALLSNGGVEAWGRNGFGQLGRGTSAGPESCGVTACGRTPGAVTGLTGVTAITTRGEHSLALLSGGGVKAWGENAQGELGIGTTDTTGCQCRPSPTPVTGLSDPVAIAAGYESSWAMLSNGTVQGWGANEYGQIGDGTTTPQDAPGPLVSGLTVASSLAGGGFNSLVLTGPTQSLDLSFAGAGSGVVGGSGILCPPTCSKRYPQGQPQILRAEPAAGSGFAGFSGPCAGTVRCLVKLDQDQRVTATFGVPKGTEITKAKVDSGKRTARFTFTAPGAITGFQCELLSPKNPLHRGSARRLKASGKHRKPHFSRCASAKSYRKLAPGRYTFKVRALDILGADAHPASRSFKVRHSKRRRH